MIWPRVLNQNLCRAAVWIRRAAQEGASVQIPIEGAVITEVEGQTIANEKRCQCPIRDPQWLVTGRASTLICSKCFDCSKCFLSNLVLKIVIHCVTDPPQTICSSRSFRNVTTITCRWAWSKTMCVDNIFEIQSISCAIILVNHAWFAVKHFGVSSLTSIFDPRNPKMKIQRAKNRFKSGPVGELWHACHGSWYNGTLVTTCASVVKSSWSSIWVCALYRCALYNFLLSQKSPVVTVHSDSVWNLNMNIRLPALGVWPWAWTRLHVPAPRMGSDDSFCIWSFRLATLFPELSKIHLGWHTAIISIRTLSTLVEKYGFNMGTEGRTPTFQSPLNCCHVYGRPRQCDQHKKRRCCTFLHAPKRLLSIAYLSAAARRGAAWPQHVSPVSPNAPRETLFVPLYTHQLSTAFSILKPSVSWWFYQPW